MYKTTRDYCPFINNPPNENCYCRKLDSMNVPLAVAYCTMNYEDCDIFRETNSIVNNLQKK